uniref:Armadillo repeat-containing domain-containing protein n=1 Tax=Fagus sylvatica TaxID=28930 RepID=A0A2N9H440_FAGSY
MDDRNSSEEGSIRVNISELQKLSATFSSGTTIFEPQSGIEKRDSSNVDPTSPTTPAIRAPEKKLTLFALQLAVLEKAATGLGTLGFIWATVVLLGGFAITLDKTDFWFITIILLIEGTRIFSRSHELEWQHQATWSMADAGINSFRALRSSSHFFVKTLKAFFRPILVVQKQSQNTRELTKTNDAERLSLRSHHRMPTRTWKSSDVPLLPFSQWVFLSRNVSKLLHWLQIVSATACVVLSLMKLIKRNYGDVEKGETDKRNRESALNIFYALTLAEALMFLTEKAYWEWKVIYRKLLDEVNKECEFGPSVIERLVEMLNWTDPQDEETRQSAAEILSKLAGKKQNCLRVAGIPGAMESISSLLQANRSNTGAADEIGEKNIIFDHANYGFWTFNHLGLIILKKLSRNHDNCGKIGNTRGLLPKIIDFTHAGERLLQDDNAAVSQILTVKRSLQLVKMLASTTGTTGKHLRKEISEIVFTISNIRDILRYGEKYPMLQKLGIDILTNLALDEDATERIGGTGGVLKGLFKIFFKEEMAENQKHVRIAAGEALTMLALESKSNCYHILKLDVLERLIGALEVPLIRESAARILRNLCTVSGADCFNQIKGVTAAVPTVLQGIMLEENKLQEVMVGLAEHVFKFMTSEEARIMFAEAGVTEAQLAEKLVQILKTHQYPPIKTPRIRRFAIELVIWMMRDKLTNVRIFKDLGTETVLEGVLETTAELESFNIFSGTVGLSRHSTTIHSLAETALKLLASR